MRSSVQRLTRSELQTRLEEARHCASKEVWEGAVRRSMAFEEAYWAMDNIHDPVGPFIVNIDSDDEKDLYLESDED